MVGISGGRNLLQTASDSATDRKLLETDDRRHASGGVVREMMLAVHPSGKASTVIASFMHTKAKPLNLDIEDAVMFSTSYPLRLWYAYAKTTAEKEAWRMAEEMDLVVGNPSFGVGPLLAPQPTSTLLMILAILKMLGFPSSEE
ncbi:hypothetical protein ACLB2K_039337 [Fragaria x ananassa]